MEQNLLQGAFGPDVGLELEVEFLEFFAVLSGDDKLGGGEAVFARILRGAGLPSSVRRPVPRRALTAFAV
jgi:hypothetical protein